MDVGGVVAAQEHHGGGHLLRSAHPARRDAGRHRPDVVGEFERPLAGIQGGVGIMLATGDLSYLEAALDAGIAALRGS